MLGETAPVKWLVIDVCDDDLNAPYSAVYCDPKQPILMMPLPYRSPKNNVTERLRDVMFRGLQLLPGGKEYILQMKYKPMPHYTQGAVLHQEGHGAGSVGRMFMQPDVETTDRKRLKLDDAIGFVVRCSRHQRQSPGITKRTKHCLVGIDRRTICPNRESSLRGKTCHQWTTNEQRHA